MTRECLSPCNYFFPVSYKGTYQKLARRRKAQPQAFHPDARKQTSRKKTKGAGGSRTHELQNCATDAGLLLSLKGSVPLCPSMGAYWKLLPQRTYSVCQNPCWESNPAMSKAASHGFDCSHHYRDQ